MAENDDIQVHTVQAYEWSLKLKPWERARSRILSSVPRPEIDVHTSMKQVILSVIDYVEQLVVESEQTLQTAEKVNQETREIAAGLGKRKIVLGEGG